MTSSWVGHRYLFDGEPVGYESRGERPRWTAICLAGWLAGWLTCLIRNKPVVSLWTMIMLSALYQDVTSSKLVIIVIHLRYHLFTCTRMTCRGLSTAPSSLPIHKPSPHFAIFASSSAACARINFAIHVGNTRPVTSATILIHSSRYFLLVENSQGSNLLLLLVSKA